MYIYAYPKQALDSKIQINYTAAIKQVWHVFTIVIIDRIHLIMSSKPLTNISMPSSSKICGDKFPFHWGHETSLEPMALICF